MKGKKTVSLRLDQPMFDGLSSLAESQNRSLGNLVETLLIELVQEAQMIDDFEMLEIHSNTRLKKQLKKAHQDIKDKKGKFV